MKKKYVSILIICAMVFSGATSRAQDWVAMMKDHKTNFFETQKAFYKYEAQYRAQYKKERGVEPQVVPGYKLFKRWEWFMKPRVSATGERFAPNAAWIAMEEYKKQYPIANAGNWTSLGPNSVGSMPGAGRINAIRIHPTDPQTIFACVPSGGLWKSTNGGTSWSTNTDWITQVIGCSDIAIDPGNPNIMYLCTGDLDHGDNYSMGLLKSTDGGATWGKTGLTYTMANFRLLGKIFIHPSNSSIILVTSTEGIWRSTNAGATFTKTKTGVYYDMEFKPGDPNTVYACGTDFTKSTDNGVNWTTTATGLPAATGVSRMAIAVTAGNSAYVYLIAGLPGPGYGTEGFYRSTNSGGGFTKQSTPNIGTQQWYDLCIAANPSTANEVLLGGQTQFLKSTNGGTSWANSGGSTHVDYHDVFYTSSTQAYLASDGGIWRSTNAGGAWSNLSNGLAIAQMYGFGQSATNANLHIQGWQDNGTNRYNGSWGPAMGGDGMLCFISKSSDQNMWGSQYDGSLNKSTNGGTNWSACKGNISGTGNWVTPWMEDPTTANTIYAGFNDVWKHTGGGGSTGWTKISTLNAGTVTLTALAVSPASSQVIWATSGTKLYKTSNGGTSWTTITSHPAGVVTDIACDFTNTNKAWISYSGFANKNKVFQTNDQGATWINLSTSLPNIPVNCITVDKNGTDALYIGTDAGVYYKNSSLSVWQPFSTNLPNVVVTQLIIFYPGSKIRASTFGRGMWESPLYVAGSYPPIANFGADNRIGCPGTAVQFTDFTSGEPTSWNWTFQGGNPASSTLQNPVVAYNTPGTYSVSLTATNGNGNDNETQVSYITINASPYNAPGTTGGARCGPGIVNLSATTGGGPSGTMRWWNAPGGGTQVATGGTYSPNLSTTTTFYVDETFPPGSDDFTGAGDNSMGTGAMFTANDIRGLYFDVLQPVVLKSVEVYSNSAGNRTIEVIDPQGNTFAETTVNIPASPSTLTTVNLNFTLYPGTGYFLKCRGLVDLYRNATGATYPYTSTAINVTGTNAGAPGYYYYFYNWTYSEIVCNTARTPVTGTINACTGINDEITGGSLAIYPNPNNGTFDLSFSLQQKDDYTVRITNALGQVVYEENVTNFSGDYAKKIDISSFGKGVYMLSLTNSNQETVKKVIVY